MESKGQQPGGPDVMSVEEGETSGGEGTQATTESTASSEVETKHAELASRAEKLYNELGNLFSGGLNLAAGEEDVEKVLEEVSFEGIASFLKSEHCMNVITMAGAGISTSAGIPDFRSPGSGLYDNLQKYNLPAPTSIFDVEFYQENPEPFCRLSKELWPGKYKPTPCHYFIKQLNDKGKLLRHYTQNIDGLELETGLPADKMVEAHGTFRSAHCITCQEPYSEQWIKGNIFADKIPKCETKDCKGLVKPDIVFFGDKLPDRFVSSVTEDFNKCDLLIIMGTSLSVQPFSSLPQRVPKKTPRLLINMDKGNTQVDPIIAMFTGGCSMDFDSDTNYRDVFKQGTCDDACLELARALGWTDELKAVCSSGQAPEKLDSKCTSEKGRASTSTTGASSSTTRASSSSTRASKSSTRASSSSTRASTSTTRASTSAARASTSMPASTSRSDVKSAARRGPPTSTQPSTRDKSSGKPATSRSSTSAKLSNKKK